MHLLLHMGEQTGAAGLGAEEGRQGGVQSAAVEVGVKITQTGRQAASHLPVGRRMLAPGQDATAMSQAKQRLELLDELKRRMAPAQWSHVDGMTGGRVGCHLEHRVGDVQTTAHVEQAVASTVEGPVAGWGQLLDQAVLEHQGTQLRGRGAVVDHLGVIAPGSLGGRGGEVSPGTPTHAHRLAHVERASAAVAEDVDTGIAGQAGEVRRGGLGRRSRGQGVGAGGA